ncbi:MAG: hypothetical protein EA384_11075 [Spirochaetaceae bacterium]|nr:MAG: hypothetical protein EA384_11075 [Spirochaetaceae bacterium]
MGKKVVAVRYPMPYGDIVAGNVIYAGVDYEAILRAAETDPAGEPDGILGDGGNNDFPFFDSDLKVVVLDPLRPGHEVAYYLSEVNLCMADVIVINKMDTAACRRQDRHDVPEVSGHRRRSGAQRHTDRFG